MKKHNVASYVALALLVLSLLAWGYQVKAGLIVTHMRNPFSWGLYIATFAFFVGIAAGGLIVSSSVYLFNLEHLKPFTRIASLSAFASTVGAAAMILPDLGRVERIYNLFLHPNFTSPLIWDVIVVSTYLVLTFLSVYFQLLPDWNKEERRFLAGWTRKLGAEELVTISKTWARRIALIGLPVAVLIHTVTALIFATQASRGWWYTAVLPPDFIAVAIASGTALVLVVSLTVAGPENFTRHRPAFRSMARIVAGALVVHFFLMYNDILVHWWWGREEAAGTLALVFGRYGLLHLTEVLLPAAVMIYFFSAAGSRSRRALFTGSALLLIGVFAHRIMLMYPAFNQFPLSGSLPGYPGSGWNYPIALGGFSPGSGAKAAEIFVSFWAYVPSLVEVAVTLLPFGLALLVIAVMVRRWDMLPSTQSSGD